MEVARIGEDSPIQRMIRLVQSAGAGKVKIADPVGHWATWIVIAALVSAALTWLLSDQVIRAVTILVMFYPCALVLTTLTVIIAAIGNTIRHSFLVWEGDTLKWLARVDRTAFDKANTLARGMPEVAAVRSLSPGVTEGRVYVWLAQTGLGSEYPLGKTVVRGWQAAGGGAPAPAENFEALPGRGLRTVLDGHTVLAGGEVLLEEAGMAFPPMARTEVEGFLAQGCTLIYLVVDGVPVGFCALTNTVRGEAVAMPRALSAERVSPVFPTGGNENAATHIARMLSVREYRTGCLPEDKLNRIDRTQQAGVRTCMVGDGINDAPTLKRVFVGIAMRGVGSDIAVDAADIALMNNRVEELPHLLALSRWVMITIHLDLALSMALNLVAIVLAMTGVLNPVVGALVHNTGFVLMILSPALLLEWRRRS